MSTLVARRRALLAAGDPSQEVLRALHEPPPLGV